MTRTGTDGIGDRIKRLMMQNGLSQRELAEKTGVAEATISRYISGKHIPHLCVISCIADALHITVEELMQKDNEENNMKNMKSAGEAIANAIERSGMTQSEVGRRLGRDASLVNVWVKGIREPTAKSLRHLSKILNMPIDDILGEGISQGVEERQCRLDTVFECVFDSMGKLNDVMTGERYFAARGLCNAASDLLSRAKDVASMEAKRQWVVNDRDKVQ